MQTLVTTLNRLSMRQQIIGALAMLAVIASVFFLASAASRPSLALLYAGLESRQAGDVVTALEQRGVAHEIRGDSIYVDAAQRDSLRMTLAAEGLPANGAKGYELLDSLSGFGTTSQMFNAAYWRAKEGELARTIQAVPQVSAARVHIAASDGNVFRIQAAPTASVSVSAALGTLDRGQAQAIRYLVASAVPGMSPDDVTVVDSQGGLIGDTTAAKLGGDAEERAAALRSRVVRLLEAHLGQGNAVVEVSLETESSREEISQRSFDPESRVAISTDTEESSENSNSADDSVTVASNLPDGDGAEGASSRRQQSQVRERINYEVSETRRDIVKMPGAIKRLSVAVLVNGKTEVGADGKETFAPLPEEQLTILRELVASAVGFDSERGDQITIKSLQFEPLPDVGTSGLQTLADRMNLDLTSIIQAALLAAVALVLLLTVVRPLLTKAPPAALDESVALPFDPTAVSASAAREIPPEIDVRDVSRDLPRLPDVHDTEPPRDPVERLRGMIGERREETVEILKNWLDEKEETV